jgi:hypothetical protein
MEAYNPLSFPRNRNSKSLVGDPPPHPKIPVSMQQPEKTRERRTLYHSLCWIEVARLSV